MNFFYLLNIILISRLFFLFKDRPVNIGQTVIMLSIQAAGLFYFSINLSWIILLLILTSASALFYVTERKAENLNLERFLFLILYFFVAGFASSEFTGLVPNPVVVKFLTSLSLYFLPGKFLELVSFYLFNLVLAGLLLLLNEINFFVRLTFKLFGLTGMWKDIDEDEFNTGRLIGMLERIFIFLLVIFNQYAAIGFIIAAKGVTRFKEMENRNFAEYILIGTLLSALSAVVVGLLVRFLIQNS